MFNGFSSYDVISTNNDELLKNPNRERRRRLKKKKKKKKEERRREAIRSGEETATTTTTASAERGSEAHKKSVLGSGRAFVHVFLSSVPSFFLFFFSKENK